MPLPFGIWSIFIVQVHKNTKFAIQQANLRLHYCPFCRMWHIEHSRNDVIIIQPEAETGQEMRENDPLAAFWMPFTANKQFKASPRLLASASGMYYKTVDGREILDATAGLWCCNAGHSRPRIVEAVKQQIGTLDFAPNFSMSSPLPFKLAERLAALAPGDLNKVFFSNSGSEAVDSALKIALAYHRVRGEGQRTRFIGREKGYHGVGFGGMSVGGLPNNRKWFGPGLPAVSHIRHTLDVTRNAFSKGLPAHGIELAEDLERQIALYDASTVAAVIVEPISGSAGVVIPPVGGDTVWANTAAAYAHRPEPLKALARSLRAVHGNDYDYAGSRAASPDVGDAGTVAYRKLFTAQVIESEHAVVQRHPITGELVLLVGHFAKRLVGLNAAESSQLLAQLQSHITTLENTVRWRWTQGDVAIWDNRATQHYAINDYGDQHRVVRRVTVVGEAAVGWDGSASVQLAGN